MPHPAFVLTAIHGSTALIGHVAKLTSSYGILIKWSAPSLMVIPHWKLNMNPLRFGSLSTRCIRVRVYSSPRFVVRNATVNSAMFVASNTFWTGSIVARSSCCVGLTLDSR